MRHESHEPIRRRGLLPLALWVSLAVSAGSCGPAEPLQSSGEEPAEADPTPPIVLDGTFQDWDRVALVLEDPVDALDETPADITRVWASHDGAWLYLSLEVTGLINIQAMQGTIHLVVDADGDPGTGGEAFGLQGADWVLDLSRQDRPQAGGYGAGFALRAVTPDGIGPSGSAYEARATGVPTHASRRFELRLAREPPSWAERYDGLGPSIRARFASTREDRVLDETEVFTVPLVHPPGPEPNRTDPSAIARIPGTLRVAHWNVAEGRFRAPARHAAVLGALRPDVILLDEVYEEVSPEALVDFFATPGLGSLGRWSFVISRGGGRQKTVVAARDRDVRQERSMSRVDYDGAQIAGLAESWESWGSAGQESLRRERETGMSATGAWVEFQGRQILFVPFDLQSAGYLDSPQDRLRVVQAETLARHVLGALEGRPPDAPDAAVVLGGDLNLVGGTAPLDRLITSFNTAGLDLRFADARRLGTGAHTTWRDSGRGPFTPGILDMTLFSQNLLEQAAGFVFTTEDLDEAELEELGLERDWSAEASDHLVVVTDLRVTSPGPGDPGGRP